MPRRALAGTRLRDRRLQAGVKQADLAAKVGISASYLNLIEHNKRNIGGRLLNDLADALGVEQSLLSDGVQASLLSALQDIAADSEVADLERDQIDEFASRFPGWVAQLALQHRRIAALEQTVGGLNDRLTHDPFLSEKMHEVLAAVSAIRSTSSILVADPDINADWRHRFHSNIDTESRRLAATSEAMAAHFDRLGQRERDFIAPPEELALFLEQNQYHFVEIENGGPDMIDGLVKAAPSLRSAAAKDLAREHLQSYARDCARLPIAPFRDAAIACNFDPAALAQQFQTDLPRVFRRLAHIPSSPDIPPIGLVSCDGAGAFRFRKQPPGFALPLFGAGCALWPLYAALNTPSFAVARRLRVSEGGVFQGYAIATSENPTQIGVTPVLTSWMLLVGVDQAMEQDEADGSVLPVGSSCRVCTRKACEARREPSILQPVA